MLQVKQFRYASDNLGYVIFGQKSAVVVDGGAVDEILDFIDTKKLTLQYVTQTHTHPDHITGNRQLIAYSDAELLESEVLIKQKAFACDGEKIEIYHTPGHTEDSVVFYIASILLTGDTLFNGNVGSCYSGGMHRFFESLKMILAFPDATRIYAGHDYVTYSMAVAKLIDPNNSDIDRFLKQYDPNCVCSSLEEERRVNPFLRFNEPGILSILKTKGLPHRTEYERWESVMSLP